MRQGVETAQALADAECALSPFGSSLAEQKGSRERATIIPGNQARALARLGRSAESLRAIEAGVREVSPSYTSAVAGFYWRAGMAMLASENVFTAIDHFRRAAQLDPEGYYRRLAVKHLSQHSVWGGAAIAGSRT